MPLPGQRKVSSPLSEMLPQQRVFGRSVRRLTAICRDLCRNRYTLPMVNEQKSLVDQAASEAIDAAVDASDVGDIEEISGLFLGYANINFRVKTTAGIYLARFCRAQPDERIDDEILLLRSIQSSGFPTSYPIPRSDGDFISRHQGEKVMLYDFVEGETPLVTPDTARQIGEALGRLSLQPVPQAYSSSALVDIEDLREFRSQNPTELQQYPEFRDEFLKQTASIESCLPFDLPRGLVHADAFPDNTIFRDGKLVALIDFEDSCVDALIFDIGMAIIGFGYRDGKIDIDQVGALLAGYRTHRQLSRAEQESLPAMARWCAHGLGFWHLRAYLDRPNDRQLQRIGEIQRMVRGLQGADAETIRAALEH